jgi:hypothetical protein
MTIPQIIKASISKIAPLRADPVLVRELEIAREKAWHTAFMDGGVIG